MVDVRTLPALDASDFGDKWVHVWDGTSPFPNYRALLSDTGATGGTSTTIEEKIRDVVAATLVEGAGIEVTVDDPGDTITIGAAGGGYTGPNHVLLADEPAYLALTPDPNTLYYIPEV